MVPQKERKFFLKKDTRWVFKINLISDRLRCHDILNTYYKEWKTSKRQDWQLKNDITPQTTDNPTDQSSSTEATDNDSEEDDAEDEEDEDEV